MNYINKESNKPRLLLITRNAWSNDISTGNTMSNFFSTWKYPIANIYCRDEKINNSICKNYFRITERELVDAFFHKRNIGTKIIFGSLEVNKSFENNKNISREKKKYDFFRNHRLQFFLWGRELIWKTGKWKNTNLNDFLNEISPNIILMPLYDCLYMYDILFYVYNYTSAKVVIYTGDDMYTLRQLSLSPLNWIDLMLRRKKIRKAIDISSMCFCLSEKQSLEYSKIFNTRFLNIPKHAQCKKITKRKKVVLPVIMLYTGNIILGRYKVLGEIGKVIEKINKENEKIQLHIYTGNQLTPKMKRALNKKGVFFHGAISNEEVKKKQEIADVLVHVEDFSFRNKMKVFMSFSTKIVDYMAKGKTIFAVGPKDVASIEYLLNKDIAIVATKNSEIEEKIKKLVFDPSIILEYGEKSYKACLKYHAKEDIQSLLYSNLENLIK